jgi:hypothetical protein
MKTGEDYDPSKVWVSLTTYGIFLAGETHPAPRPNSYWLFALKRPQESLYAFTPNVLFGCFMADLTNSMASLSLFPPVFFGEGFHSLPNYYMSHDDGKLYTVRGLS